MNAWGTGSFDNEHATEWLDELVESRDLSAIIMALQTVIELGGTEDLADVDCACAVAAAEVVAAAAGRGAKTMPRKVTLFVEEARLGASAPVIQLALRALKTVRSNSSLRTHWKADGTLFEWLEEIEALEARLKPGAKGSADEGDE